MKRRLVHAKLRDCLRALERAKSPGRLEVDLERALAEDDAKSLQIIEGDITRVLAEFEAYLEERGFWKIYRERPPAEASPFLDAANESRSTLELMRCVREDENVADDAVRLDAVCERLRELETDDGWRGKLLAEVDGARNARLELGKLLVRIDAVFLVD